LELFEAKGYLDVFGCHSGKRYRIYYDTVANIRELNDDGEPRAGLCFASTGTLPTGDVVLAQKLALETDELAAIAVVNRFPTTTAKCTSWRRI
jgi:hypothetical protein